MCTVRLRHKDKTAQFRFFVVPGDDPALLGILKIMGEAWEVIGQIGNSTLRK